MLLRIRETGELLTGDQFAALNPNTTLANPLTQDHADALDADLVEEIAAPQPGEFERVFDDGIELVGGRWRQKYRIDRWTAAEIADHSLRRQAVAREAAKQARQAAVDSIQVTVSSGKTFDGNEPAQANLLLAVQVAQIAGLTEAEWTLADNTRVPVTLDEIKEALTLAALEKSRLWALEYAE